MAGCCRTRRDRGKEGVSKAVIDRPVGTDDRNRAEEHAHTKDVGGAQTVWREEVRDGQAAVPPPQGDLPRAQGQPGAQGRSRAPAVAGQAYRRKEAVARCASIRR